MYPILFKDGSRVCKEQIRLEGIPGLCTMSLLIPANGVPKRFLPWGGLQTEGVLNGTALDDLGFCILIEQFFVLVGKGLIKDVGCPGLF